MVYLYRPGVREAQCRERIGTNSLRPKEAVGEAKTRRTAPFEEPKDVAGIRDACVDIPPIRLIVITRTAGHKEHASDDQTHAKPSESLLETSAAVPLPLGDAWVDAGFLAYPPRGYRPCMPTLPILPPPSLLPTTPRFTETLSRWSYLHPGPSFQRERRKLARR